VQPLYLIFSHDNPLQLARLARAIRDLSPAAEIAIHHDPGGSPLDSTLIDAIDRLRLIPDPIKGGWGDFSLVEQYLHSLRWCREHIPFDWVCTLTGLTYPVGQLKEFENRLSLSHFDGFVRYFDAFDPGPYPKGMWPRGTGETRYLYRYFKLPPFPYYHRLPDFFKRLVEGAQSAINRSSGPIRVVSMPRRAGTHFGIRRRQRQLPPNFVICGGRQMLNLNRRAVDRVLAFVDAHPEYVQYFRQTLIPDEAFFTSIVANDPELHICNDVLRFIKWPKQVGAASVAVITKDEVKSAIDSGAPFALKLDMRTDPEALDLIDAHLGLESDRERIRMNQPAT
jgi:hypothetical protein